MDIIALVWYMKQFSFFKYILLFPCPAETIRRRDLGSPIGVYSPITQMYENLMFIFPQAYLIMENRCSPAQRNLTDEDFDDFHTVIAASLLEDVTSEVSWKSSY